MKAGDKVTGIGFDGWLVENVYTDLKASGTTEYKEVTMMSISKDGKVKSIYIRDVDEIEKAPEKELQVAELKEWTPQPVLWEYTSTLNTEFEHLNKMGSLGWEAVCAFGNALLLKRAIVKN